MAALLRSAAALAADLRCLARRHGARRALGTAARGLADTFRAREELIVLSKRLDAVADIPHDGRLRLGDLDPGALPALAELNRASCQTRADLRFAASLAKGHRGFLARCGDEPAGYYWWIDRRADPGHPHLARLGIELGGDAVYGYDFFLAEPHRGSGNAHQFLEHVERRLRELGYATLWGYVRSDNRPARWLYAVRGYEEVGRVHLTPGRMRL